MQCLQFKNILMINSTAQEQKKKKFVLGSLKLIFLKKNDSIFIEENPNTKILSQTSSVLCVKEIFFIFGK